jgi:hypothetical protein
MCVPLLLYLRVSVRMWVLLCLRLAEYVCVYVRMCWCVIVVGEISIRTGTFVQGPTYHARPPQSITV